MRNRTPRRIKRDRLYQMRVEGRREENARLARAAEQLADQQIDPQARIHSREFIRLLFDPMGFD